MKFLAFILMVISASAVGAAELPATALLSMGFKEVKLEDVGDVRVFERRAARSSGYLSVSEDLNGDGKADETRILQNHDRQIAYVVSVIVTDGKVDTFVLGRFPMSEVPYLGIMATGAAGIIAPANVTSGIAVFDLRTGKGEKNIFDGADFGIRVPFELEE